MSEPMEDTEQSKEDKKPKKTPSLNLAPGLIHWTKNQKDEIEYLVKNNGVMEILNSVTIAGKVFKPNQNIAKVFKIPDENISQLRYEYSPAALLKELEFFIYNHVEMPDDKPEYYLILALWVMQTYTIEHFTASPIIYAHGQKASGKSRLGSVLNELAFRGMFITDPTDAAMFRICESYNPTILIDEIILLGKFGNPQLANLLKSRYKNTCVVPRCNMLIKNKDDVVEFFNIWGPTVLTTTENLGDYIDDRALEFLMKKNTRPIVEKNINLTAAESLRNKLIYFRFHWIDKQLTECDSITQGRLGEIINPLWQLLNLVDDDPYRLNDFVTFLRATLVERNEREFDSFQAKIYKAVLSVIKNKSIPEFTTVEIVNTMNIGKEKDPHKFTDTYIGEKIRIMNFKRCRIGTHRGWSASDTLLKALNKRFGIPENFKPETTAEFGF
jgi:hypothetical protein